MSHFYLDQTLMIFGEHMKGTYSGPHVLRVAQCMAGMFLEWPSVWPHVLRVAQCMARMFLEWPIVWPHVLRVAQCMARMFLEWPSVWPACS